MRTKIGLSILLLGLFVMQAAAVTAAEEASQPIPTAFFPESKYAFVPVVEGTKVTHDYIVQNKGTAPLNIARVKTG